MAKILVEIPDSRLAGIARALEKKVTGLESANAKLRAENDKLHAALKESEAMRADFIECARKWSDV